MLHRMPLYLIFGVCVLDVDEINGLHGSGPIRPSRSLRWGYRGRARPRDLVVLLRVREANVGVPGVARIGLTLCLRRMNLRYDGLGEEGRRPRN